MESSPDYSRSVKLRSASGFDLAQPLEYSPRRTTSENALSIKAPRSIRNSSVNRHAVGTQIRNRTRCFPRRTRGSCLTKKNRGEIFPRSRTEMVEFPHAHTIDDSHT